MTASGFDSQVGYAIESPVGTFTAPTRAIEHVKFGLKSTRPDIVSQGIKTGRRSGFRRMKGVEVCAGAISHELSPANTGLLLVNAVGAVSTTGAGPYTHAITAGPLVETRPLSIQGGVPSFDGTINPFNFVGCQVKAGSISVKKNAAVMLDFDWVAQHLQNTGDGDTVAGLTAAVYSATWAPFTSLNAVLTINAVEYEFDEVTLKFDNGLRTGNYTSRATNPSRAKLSKEEGQRAWTMSVTSDFWNLTAMNRAYAGTEVSYSLAFTSGTTSLTVAGNCRTQPESPTQDGVKLTGQTLNLDLLSSTSDAAAMTWTLVNSDSAP